MATKAFQAQAKGQTATATTPRAAAIKFFERFPNRRKCNVYEGEADGIFFVMRFSGSNPPRSWKDVTAKTAGELPDTEAA